MRRPGWLPAVVLVAGLVVGVLGAGTASATFTRQVAAPLTASTATVPAPTGVATTGSTGPLSCAGARTYTVALRWTAVPATTRGLTGYRVVETVAGAVVTDTVVQATTWSRTATKARTATVQHALVVTTLTAHGWTAAAPPVTYTC